MKTSTHESSALFCDRTPSSVTHMMLTTAHIKEEEGLTFLWRNLSLVIYMVKTQKIWFFLQWFVHSQYQ